MDEYIELAAVLGEAQEVYYWNGHEYEYEDFIPIEAVLNIPAADAISFEAYKQVRWERDVAIEQLREINKSLGEKMDDVAPVVHGRWLDCEVHNDIEQCSECGMIFHYPSYYGYRFCPNCGAKMDKEEI